MDASTTILAEVSSTAVEMPSQTEEDNIILNYAKPILTLMIQVRNAIEMPQVIKLHQQFVEEINHFIKTLEQSGLPAFQIECAAYCLCAAIDEAVLATDWGTQSIWVQKSLLSMLRSDTLGGEKFYLIAARLAEEPRKNIQSIELIYVLLSLGFEGQYYGQKQSIRNEIKDRLYHIIWQERGKISKRLSPNWFDQYIVENSIRKKKKIKLVSIASASVLGLLYIIYSISLYHLQQPTISSLQKIGHESPITAYSQLIDRELFHNAMNEGDSNG